MERSIRWLDRCIAAHKKPDVQNLFGIIQGGLQAPLRRRCLEEMIKRDLPGTSHLKKLFNKTQCLAVLIILHLNLFFGKSLIYLVKSPYLFFIPPIGYAIGGLAGGEDKEEFWRVVDLCATHLPSDKPRYLMGVGYPVDLLVCVAMGVDMFDCVWPCRTARFGTAIVPDGLLKLSSTKFAEDHRVLCETCLCDVCSKWKYPRSYLHHIAGKQPLGCHLLSIHNMGYMAHYMKLMRESLLAGRFEAFVRENLALNFADHRLPAWVWDALTAQDFDLAADYEGRNGFVRDEGARAAADVRTAPKARPEGMRDPEAAKAAAAAAARAAQPVEVALAALAQRGATAGAATGVEHGSELATITREHCKDKDYDNIAFTVNKK